MRERKGGGFVRNTRSMLGMPVICRGEPIGRVSQVRLSEDLRRLEGISLNRGLAGSRYIECADLDLLGEVAVLSHTRGKRAKTQPAALPRRAIGPDGERLGAVTDAYIDEESFGVAALELTRGYLEDLTAGRDRVSDYSVCPGGEILIDRTEGGNRT